MKRILACALLLAICLGVCGSAAAQQRKIEVTAVHSSDRYSDAPANPTQDNLLEITATAIPAEDEAAPFMLMKMLPTQLTVDELVPIYDFVEINLNPPARYFPEEVQQTIIDIGFDPDVLYMPEFFSTFPQVYPDALEDQVHVDVEMLYDIDYLAGLPVVVVLGWDSDEGVEWQALPADVPRDHYVHFDIPPETLKIINGQETLFALLTVKPGSGYGEYYSETIKIPYEIPSITSGDLTLIVDGYTAVSSGEPIPCELVLVDRSRRITLELDAIEKHIHQNYTPESSRNYERESIMSYFKSEMNRQVHLLLPETVANDDLMCYEIACLQSVEYIEPYGDVMARFLFATPYYEGQTMVSMLALPDEENPEDEMVWTPLHTEVKRIYTDEDHFIDYVEITFSSAVLTPMLEETALLLVLSTPMPETL